MMYWKHGQYDGRVGRYVSRDPLGYRGGPSANPTTPTEGNPTFTYPEAGKETGLNYEKWGPQLACRRALRLIGINVAITPEASSRLNAQIPKRLEDCGEWHGRSGRRRSGTARAKVRDKVVDRIGYKVSAYDKKHVVTLTGAITLWIAKKWKSEERCCWRLKNGRPYGRTEVYRVKTGPLRRETEFRGTCEVEVTGTDWGTLIRTYVALYGTITGAVEALGL
jgi:hypothetical protein